MTGERMWMRAITIGLLALMTAACGNRNETTPAETDETVEQPQPSEQPTMASDCHGNKVPPTNYLQETAFIPASSPNATEEAGQAAATKLRDRICQGYRCNELAPLISLWHTAHDATQVCAMAVIKADQVAEFKSGPSKRFDSDLSTRAAALVTTMASKSEPRIAFDNITDMGVDGGARAEWLVDRMTAALSKQGALISTVPADWSGIGVPRGTDAVLRANITPMHGREAMLEVTWKIQLKRGMKAVDPIAFPELIGPSINPLSQLPALAGINPDVGLRFDARPGGGLCNGQITELRLETSKNLHVRVINLFGDGSRGIVIFASPDAVKAQQTVSLGEFEVVKATDIPVERFLVLGAESKAGLGQLADVRASCRLPTDFATQLSSNRAIPDGAKDFVASRSYRILEGDECSSFQPQNMEDNWYQSFPPCF